MSTDIQNFDVTSHIRDQVRKVLVTAIPNEKMDEMIKREFDDYFSKDSSYQAKSQFEQLVQDELKQRIAASIKSWLDTNFILMWNETTQRQELVGDLVKKLVPIVQTQMAADITQQALLVLRNNMGQL